ncbi:hypothetical protein LNTAR_19252 [Lentisphaera araneosa HTCC2155]|jgi:hypothetical protein|uniref:Lipoprotein n=1 Tax=Lentisphaera araneosa HTCC2155 TaxID=313628 RepID=A6DQR6_9BACT|nr:hypothetical protein LNTAR_19252 [Lentisphaera araneosa HTCC2155]
MIKKLLLILIINTVLTGCSCAIYTRELSDKNNTKLDESIVNNTLLNNGFKIRKVTNDESDFQKGPLYAQYSEETNSIKFHGAFCPILFFRMDYKSFYKQCDQDSTNIIKSFKKDNIELVDTEEYLIPIQKTNNH